MDALATVGNERLPAAGLVVPLRPPTPVCEHGRMVLSVLVAAKGA